MANDTRKGLAAYSARDAAPRFQSLCASTFSSLQERIRLGQEVAASTEASEHAFLRTFPYFARDKTIAKNLHTLMDALDTWNAMHANGDLMQSEDIPSLEQLGDWAATVHRLTALLGQTNNELNDPRGSEILQELRSAYVEHSHSHPHVFGLESPNNTQMETQTESAEAPGPSSPPRSRVEFISEVDDMHTDQTTTQRLSNDREAAQQLALHTSAFQDQDTHLDSLSASISRQHHLSLRMNEELELHSDLLHDLDRGVDHTELRLGGASNYLDRFRQSMNEHGKSKTNTGSVWVIFVLIIVLVLLIALFK